jgi:hypothetical protein
MGVLLPDYRNMLPGRFLSYRGQLLRPTFVVRCPLVATPFHRRASLRDCQVGISIMDMIDSKLSSGSLRTDDLPEIPRNVVEVPHNIVKYSPHASLPSTVAGSEDARMIMHGHGSLHEFYRAH